MSNTINVNYMTRAYNQYQQKNAAKDQEKEDTRFADSVCAAAICGFLGRNRYSARYCGDVWYNNVNKLQPSVFFALTHRVLAPLAYDSWRLVQKLYLLPAFNLKAFPELWQMAKAEIWCAYQ